MTCAVKLLSALLFTALFFAACDKSTKPEFGNVEGQLYTIAYLKSRCKSSNTLITQDICIRGVVTANDRYGEFPKTLVLEDASGGISIAADHNALADDYPFGTTLTVYCNSLTLTEYGGKIQLGTTPGEYGAGRIPREDLPRYLRSGTSGAQAPTPALHSFGDIGMEHTDTYVRFDGVHFTRAGLWCDTDPETHRPVTSEREIADAAGHTFTIRIPGTCTYAKEPVPEGTGSLCGIIDYFNGKFSLRVTNYETLFATSAMRPTACL